jgi:hypothetical protein
LGFYYALEFEQGSTMGMGSGERFEQLSTDGGNTMKKIVFGLILATAFVGPVAGHPFEYQCQPTLPEVTP